MRSTKRRSIEQNASCERESRGDGTGSTKHMAEAWVDESRRCVARGCKSAEGKYLTRTARGWDCRTQEDSRRFDDLT